MGLFSNYYFATKKVPFIQDQHQRRPIHFQENDFFQKSGERGNSERNFKEQKQEEAKEIVQNFMT